MKLLFILFFLAQLFQQNAQAQLFECEGKWTNKPCNGKVEKELSVKEEKTGIVGISSNPDRAKKSSLYHELMMKSVKAKNDFQIETNLDQAEDKCLKGDYTLEECQTQIDSYNKELDSKIHKAEILKLKKEEVQLQKERNKIAQENNTTTVIERRPVYIFKNNEPKHKPAPSTSISINANSASTNTQVKIQSEIIRSEADVEKLKVQKEKTKAKVSGFSR